ncbi:HAMP domain-containing histidine kinase [Streptomyces sp. A7024]|uniref:histidine kinase n=1 Tax=Streptomyces coryli TaxID=1128680 RepID=A0A6G4U3S1_9ACTN|nr:HAMP domain-containing sensor histidine kinase [Streptomyces coryli]NGN66814.1 HAMP domain-containing histidine kinase [Streptomyces coryli]
MIARLNRLPLRSRLALLTAAAVAVAVAACATVAWFLVRGQLISSLDDELRKTRLNPEMLANLTADGQCVDKLPEREGRVLELAERTLTVQTVTPEGDRCVIIGKDSLPVDDEDTDIAKGEPTQVLRTVIASDGTKYRALTRQLDGYSASVIVARPLSEVDDSLNTLAIVLAILAAAGAIGSAGAGVALARAGLRPVERLTGTVEHVAATEDLSVRIPVEGDDEIARLSRSFNAMTEALASSRERQQQLIADAGHELRTPLTSLRTNIELLARSEESGRPLPPGDKKELLTSVKAQMAELAALIGDLQELARPDTVPGARPPQVVGLHEIAQKAVSRARLRAADRVGVVAELAPWFVRAEPVALERAVVNLLDNAVKFSPEGAEIEVRIHPESGELTVRDHGPGIPPDDLPHVFERFWRSPAHRGLPGSGLGLSIAARTVQQAGGAIELRAADGGGTLASVRIPGAPEAPPAPPPTDATNGMPRTGEGPAAD